MDRVEVAVRRPQGPDERLRVGAVLSRTGTLARVRWNDDGVVEEDVRLGGENLLAVVGTRRHQFLMDLPSLIERFTADPVAVVLDLLRESPKGLKAPAIKELLVELGLDPAIVDRTWRSLQARLARHDDVQIKANTYRWKRPGRARDAADPSTPPVPPDPSAPQAPSEFPAPGAEATGSPVPGAAPGPSLKTSVALEAVPGPSRTVPAVPEAVPDVPPAAAAVPETTPAGAASAAKPATVEALAAAVREVPEKADTPGTAVPVRADQKARRKTERKAGRKDAPEGDEAAAPADRTADDDLSRPSGQSGPPGLSEAAEERARALAERYERLERDLRTANDRAMGLRSAQERRIRLDGVRALADLAAEIEEMVTAGATPETVVGRVRDLVAAQALHPIGAAGEEEGFDPEAHEPLNGTFEPGTPVRVVRPGYRWITSEESLLHRALVERPHA